jgi:hypothetical protein
MSPLSKEDLTSHAFPPPAAMRRFDEAWPHRIARQKGGPSFIAPLKSFTQAIRVSAVAANIPDIATIGRRRLITWFGRKIISKTQTIIKNKIFSSSEPVTADKSEKYLTRSKNPEIFPLKINRLRNIDDYNQYIYLNKESIDIHNQQISDWARGQTGAFSVPGYSYTAKRNVNFLVDFQYSTEGIVNWREHVTCPATHLNNRMRGTIHIFDTEMNFRKDSSLYLTEQITPMFSYFRKKYNKVTGSEYLGNNIPGGDIDAKGRRHEDLTKLSFQDGEFDAIVSLDVIEHIPSYKRAFEEAFRVIKRGGRLLWTVPFNPSQIRNTIRAEIVNGKIVHLLPPEYHGDPLSDAGCLCFTNFGWEMLEQVRAAGFRDAYAIPLQSLEFGYLGDLQLQFIAVK